MSKSAQNDTPTFPSLTNNRINLPYNLNQDQSATINIYNLRRQIVEQKIIDRTFDQLKLNVNNYPTGVYIYEYNGISNKFTVCH